MSAIINKAREVYGPGFPVKKGIIELFGVVDSVAGAASDAADRVDAAIAAAQAADGDAAVAGALAGQAAAEGVVDGKVDLDGANADAEAFRTAIGADLAANVLAPSTASAIRSAPAFSTARAERVVVDVLRSLDGIQLGQARAGTLDIASFVQAIMTDFGAADFVLADPGTFRWGSMVDLPFGARFRAANMDARIRPTSGLGSALDASGGCAIRISQPHSGVESVRWLGTDMGAAACVIIDAGGGALNDTFVTDCESEDGAAFCYDRGTGAGTSGVGRHYVTHVERNIFRRARGTPLRIRYGFGFLYYLNNVTDFPGSSSPNQLAFDMDGAAMSALSDAGGLFYSMVVGGTASEGASSSQRGASFKNTGEVTLEIGSSCDGLGGIGFDFEDVKLVRPDKVLARYCNDVAVRFTDVDGVEGGDFDITGRQGISGSATNKAGVLLQGACGNFKINRIAVDSATGNAFKRADGGMPLIDVNYLTGRNCGRRMLQLDGGSGSFFAPAASSVSNNLTGADASDNYEVTSAADKIPNFRLPSGGVTAVVTPSAG